MYLLIIGSDNRLTVFYSDQRDSKSSKKISQQSATQLNDSWGTAFDVAASSTLSDQQGMASVAKVHEKLAVVLKHILTS
jgi:hypothetical protein